MTLPFPPRFRGGLRRELPLYCFLHLLDRDGQLGRTREGLPRLICLASRLKFAGEPSQLDGAQRPGAADSE